MGRPTPKEKVIELVSGLPDNVTLEDIQYHIYVWQRAARGMAEADAGQTIAQHDMKKRLRRRTRQR